MQRSLSPTVQNSSAFTGGFGSAAFASSGPASSRPVFPVPVPGFGFGSATDGGGGLFGARPGVDRQDLRRSEKPMMADSEADDLTLLIRLQSASGSFVWGDVIAKLWNRTQEDLMAANPGSGEDLWITTLAIRALEEMTSQKDLWELIVQKAKKFVVKQLGEAGLENLLAVAAKIPRN